MAESAASFWLERLPPARRRPPLTGPLDVDVCVVGAGYTGLWTAYYLLEAAPALKVAVLERRHVGFGASGRNGGWVSAKVAGLDRLLKDPDAKDAALAMQREMYATVTEVGDVVAGEGIDCGFVQGGTLLAATTAAQATHLQEYVASKHAVGFGEEDHRWLGRDEAATRFRPGALYGAAFTPHCAAVDPARLVTGLAEAVERRGAVIYEDTEATVDGGRVTVGGETVTAHAVVDAREAYRLRDRAERRAMIPVYSLMVMTEPLGEDRWAEIGLEGRETFSDGRLMIIYGQRTDDGRIAFGGRGAPYHFGSTIRPEFDRDESTFAMLRRTLETFIPAVAGTRYEGAWGGPLGIPRDWHPSVIYDPATGLARASGYVGQGVAAANLAGRTLSDLILERPSPLLDFPWVGHRSPSWEPEPLRWIGVNLGRKLTESIDAAEDRGGTPRLRRWLLGRLPVG